MELQLVDPRPQYAPPPFAAPPRSGYLYLAAAVAPPGRAPFVRADARRSALLTRLGQLAGALEQLAAVVSVTVYRAVLVPPAAAGVPHPARYDVAVLVEADSPDALGEIRTAEAYRQLVAALEDAASDVHVLAARCLRSLGEVDRRHPGLFLFNHFVADDPVLATALWEHLAGWYAAETGLDNSTLLAPIEADDYVFVNHARWDKGVLRLAAEQFGKKSFRSYVLANLRANHVVAMPILYRLAGPQR